MTNNVQTCCYNGGRKLRCEPQWRARKMDLEKWFHSRTCRLCCRPKEYLVFPYLCYKNGGGNFLKCGYLSQPPFSGVSVRFTRAHLWNKSLRGFDFFPLAVRSLFRAYFALQRLQKRLWWRDTIRLTAFVVSARNQRRKTDKKFR